MGKKVVEVRSWSADAMERDLEFVGQNVHLFGGSAAVRREPEFTAGPGQDPSPVSDDESSRQMEIEHP
jgi:hypothetical protein